MQNPTAFIIFGVTGDLARHKIVPALFALYRRKKLPEQFTIIGFARRDFSDKAIQEMLLGYFPKDIDPKVRDTFLSHVQYQQGYFDEEEKYHALEQKVRDFEKEIGGAVNKLLHLSVRPSQYTDVIHAIGKTMLVEESSNTWARLLIEKPFGRDSKSARALNQEIQKICKPEQIFRVDHYLGKHWVREILSWKKEARVPMDDVQKITVSLLEKKDVDSRGAFYDEVGALRDVGQNHLLEVLALFVTDMGSELSPDARADILEAITPKQVLARAQYRGFREVEVVDPQSDTETFFHVVAETDRFALPVHLQAGKALAEDDASLTLHFTDGTIKVFSMQSGYPTPDAYEEVLFDAMENNTGYFVSLREVIAGWDFVAKVQKLFDTTELAIYEKRVKVEEI